MRQLSTLIILIFGLLSLAYGQSHPSQTSKPPTHPTTNASTSVKPPGLKYLTAPLDLERTNLGLNFKGHNIIAVISAIRNSPALKEKSEFESTAAFEARRAAFIGRPLFGTLMPDDFMGFVLDEDPSFPPHFKYNADSQQMVITLGDSYDSAEAFNFGKDQPTLDTVFIRRIVGDEDSYVGVNAFGAKVKVQSTESAEYGLAFDRNNWLFRSSEKYSRQFTYSIAMASDEARAFKLNARLLLVCSVIEPWLHSDTHGHRATISDPYETFVQFKYLHAVPEQLWIFNSRTGEVLRKLTENQ